MTIAAARRSSEPVSQTGMGEGGGDKQNGNVNGWVWWEWMDTDGCWRIEGGSTAREIGYFYLMTISVQ